MNSQERREVVAAIHAGPVMLVLAVAGGGNAVITDLLDVPGASRTVLEVRVPYAATAMTDLVGPVLATNGAVSQAVAEAMALACLDRARVLAPEDRPPAGQTLLGIGVTAALRSDRPKKGEHRAHVSVADSGGVHHRSIQLVKGERDRRGEDRVVADVVLREILARTGTAVSYRR